MTGLGARITEARKRAGLSQATLGHRLGVGQTAVSYWEKGKREPGLDSLMGVARECGVTLALLAGSDTTPDQSYWAGYRAGWLACADNARAAVALDPMRMPPRGTPMPPGVLPLPVFGLRDHRVTGLGVGEPWITTRARDLAEAWPELIEMHATIAAGDAVVRRDRPGGAWRVVGMVSEDGSLIEPGPETGAAP